MYSGHRIALFVINWCNHSHIPITNLKLQKLLYFIQGEYAGAYGVRLIRDDFYAWQLGPVIPAVYSSFAIYASFSIPPIHPTDGQVTQDVALKLHKILSKYARIPTWDLVNLSHKQDPWKYNHQIFGEKALIPYASIAQFFREEHRS